MWRSFCANHNTSADLSCDVNYDKHGHVGFAWGARREVLDFMPLYDKALIGGAEHIMAHAAAGQIGHSCITKSFTDDIDSVNAWSRLFYRVIDGKIGYVKGELYHIWHGDLGKRQYLKRIQDFTSTAKNITERDENGLHVTTNGDDEYVKQYFDHREDTQKDEAWPVLKTMAEIDEKAKEVKVKKPRAKRVKKDLEVERRQYRENLVEQYPDEDDSFIESLMLGYLTNSTVEGSLLGGNILGAAIGDALNDTDEFSGGEYGSEEFEPNNNNDYSSENFS
jgi:hypothetical protein